jgi:ubiquitin C-terminal hydrolase
MMGGGHYVSSCRYEGDTWIRYDDETVAQMPTENVNNGDTYVILLEQQNNSRLNMDILSHK